MLRRPPRSTRTDTLFPYTTLFRSGLINGRVRLTGQGDSVRKSLGSANGNIRFVIDHGTISNLAVALAGLDIARALGLWATGDAPIPLRCFVADFAVRKGVMTPKNFVLDSTRSEERRVGKGCASTCRSQRAP